MTLSATDLTRTAAETGFRAEILEKVVRLITLLNALRSHPYLRPRIALKGGTAINLFFFNVPRLSVDIDLNYVGSVDLDTMKAERPIVEKAVKDVCNREGLSVQFIPSEHSGGKWTLRYESAMGRGGNLELDLNFISRAPLWPPILRDSYPVGSFRAEQFPVLDIHELAAGKLKALFERTAARDLFDAHGLLQSGNLDRTRLRLGFVIYGGTSPVDWRGITIDDIRTDVSEVKRHLLPMLRTAKIPKGKNLDEWAYQLVSECKELLSGVLPLSKNEIDFLTRLNDSGEIVPELIYKDAEMQARISQNPALLWKAKGVRR